MRISAVLGQGVCLFYYCCYPSAWTNASLQFSSVQFSRSVVSDSLQPHESQHDRPPGPSPNSGVHSNSGLTRARQIEGAWAYYEWINKTSHSVISKWFVFKFQSLWTFQAIYFFFFFFSYCFPTWGSLFQSEVSGSSYCEQQSSRMIPRK